MHHRSIGEFLPPHSAVDVLATVVGGQNQLVEPTPRRPQVAPGAEAFSGCVLPVEPRLTHDYHVHELYLNT